MEIRAKLQGKKKKNKKNKLHSALRQKWDLKVKKQKSWQHRGCLTWAQEVQETGKQREIRESQKYLLFSSPMCFIYQATEFSWFASHKPRWLTNTVLLVPVELIARMAKALKSPHSVLTAMLTTTIVHAAFIDIWGGERENTIGERWLLCSPCLLALPCSAQLVMCADSPPQWASPYKV